MNLALIFDPANIPGTLPFVLVHSGADSLLTCRKTPL